MGNRVSLPWRIQGLQLAAAAVLAACGGSGSMDSAPVPGGNELQQVAQIPSCAFSQVQVLVDEIRITLAKAKDIVVTLPKPRAVDLLDPGSGVLEALQVAPLTQEALEVSLRTVGDSTVRLEDGTVAELKVPGQLPLVGDFHLAAGMVADLVVQGFDRCGDIQAAGQTGQFVLTGHVPAFVRALPFVTGREQVAGGSLRPLPDGGYATVSSPAAGGFKIQRFNAYGQSTGQTTTVSIDSTATAPSATPLAGGDVLAVWLGPAVDPGAPVGEHLPLMMQRFASDGTQQEAPVQIALTQPFTSRTTPPNLPQVAALAGGGAALAWVQLDDSNLNVHLQRFAANGSAAGAAQLVDIDAAGGLSNVVGLAGDRVLVAWGVGPLHARVFDADDAVLRLAPDGASLASPPLLADGAMPSVAALPDGGFVVAWLTQGNVRGRRFGVDATPSDAFTQANVTDASASGLSVAALPWGGFLIGWRTVTDGSAQDFVRFFDARGLTGD